MHLLHIQTTVAKVNYFILVNPEYIVLKSANNVYTTSQAFITIFLLLLTEYTSKYMYTHNTCITHVRINSILSFSFLLHKLSTCCSNFSTVQIGYTTV